MKLDVIFEENLVNNERWPPWSIISQLKEDMTFLGEEGFFKFMSSGQPPEGVV